MTAFDVDALRERFPALSLEQDGRPIAFFDGPGGTQVPQTVIDADLAPVPQLEERAVVADGLRVGLGGADRRDELEPGPVPFCRDEKLPRRLEPRDPDSVGSVRLPGARNPCLRGHFGNSSHVVSCRKCARGLPSM